MDNKEFARIYKRMKEEGAQADALLHDRWATLREDVNDAHGESLDRIQADLEHLVQHELTEDQVNALRNIRFKTGRRDVECDGVTVLDPRAGEGAFAYPLEMAKETGNVFEALLAGLGTIQVQGTKSGYMPVRIEREKTIDKKK